ncbi:shikimate dehydrogenase [Arthrobacter sp. PM3]|uniref:shikimate dehydrogenase family protein n=1 Tax=Arthrobacter sp. PM3 TaxID=2017685 RepID=UPI000E10E741|nr:shikimate dehydrogenase [Arthrobacter sp. PM3]AXJ11642.1 shikimate dehydrogenase [Arthrobacter sp. PM3]
MDIQNLASRLFLIGSEASRAMSPGLWNPVLEELGGRWSYEAWDVPRGAPMSRVRARLLGSDVVAANVTMPHKQWAARAADTVSEAVRLSGASNLLIRKDGMLAAHNTDVAAVAALLGGRHQRHVVMLGAGGAARAALVALKGLAGRVTVADRDPEAARQLHALAGQLGMDAETATWADAQEQASRASLIVNATPVGKRSEDAPVWGGSRLAGDAFVYDFVYAGHVTGTIAAAREQGLRHADGWDHLRAQAAAMIPLLGLAPQTDALLQRTLAAIQAKG